MAIRNMLHISKLKAFEALWRKLRDQYLNVEVEIEIER